MPNGRRATSPVIAALILSACVLAVGGAVWHFSQGAMTVIAIDYINSIDDLIEELSERFIVEHVNHSGTHVSIWVYNYGTIPVVVDVYVDIDGGASGQSLDIEMPSQGLIDVCIELVITKGDEVAVKAVSRRGNNAYYRYLAP